MFQNRNTPERRTGYSGHARRPAWDSHYLRCRLDQCTGDRREEDRGREDRGEWRRSRFHLLHETIYNVGGKEGKHHHVRQQRGYLHTSHGLERIQEILRYRPRHQDIDGSRRRSWRVLRIIGRQCVDSRYGPLHEYEPDRVRFGQPESGNLVCRCNGLTRRYYFCHRPFRLSEPDQ